MSRTTRLVGLASVAGAVIAAAGFAHVLPTHLPQINVGSSGNGSGSGSSNGSGGLQGPNNAPGTGSGSSHVRSGGS